MKHVKDLHEYLNQDAIEERLSSSTIDRMDGLTNQKSLATLNSAVETISADLLDDGFEPSDVRDYLTGILDKQVRNIIKNWGQ
jgi:hypothetical protein